MVASPLGKNVLARSAIGLAAIEIAKAVASGFRTDLHHHVVSLDLLASTVVRHHVPARPQCPSCGSRELRDPARVAAPIRLRVGGRAVMTSRGYRSVAPAETVARFRKHVSPLTGVVSQLERIKSEQPADFGFLARHNFSPRPEALDAPQARLIGDSYGKGSTAERVRSKRADAGHRTLLRDIPGRRDQNDPQVCGFPGGRRDPSQRHSAVERSAACAGPRWRIALRRGMAPLRSVGRDGMVAGLVAARRALQAPSDRPPVFFSRCARQSGDQCRLERLCSRQQGRGSDRSRFPRTRRARCLRDLVVQSLATRRDRPR